MDFLQQVSQMMQVQIKANTLNVKNINLEEQTVNDNAPF